MNSLTFVTSAPHGFTGFLRGSATPISCKPRNSSVSRQQRRASIRNENLNPDVEPSESTPNPQEKNKKSRKPGDSKEPFLKRLNDRTAQRQATDAVATPLEDSESVPESTSAEAGRVVGYSSTPLAPEQAEQKKPNYMPAARALWRLGWLSWWIQLILSVISAVILLFSFAFPGVNVRTSASALGFVLSGVGVLIAFISLFWTYSYTRLSLWLEHEKGTPEQARSKISSRLRFGFLFSIAGLLVSLIGLQAIVGTLLARLFGAGIATTPYAAYQTGTAGGAGGLVPGTGIVQPVDILVVQASANAMTALLTALMVTSWLRSREKVWNKEAKAQ